MNRTTIGVGLGAIIVAVTVSVVAVVVTKGEEREKQAQYFAAHCPDATTNEECNAAMSARAAANAMPATPWRTPQAMADRHPAGTESVAPPTPPPSKAAVDPAWERDTTKCLVAARKAIAAMARCGLKFNYENPNDPFNLCLNGSTVEQLSVLASASCAELRDGCNENPGFCQP